MNEKRLVLILGLAGFVVMADNWVVSPILPAIAQSLNVSPVRAGLLITAYMIPFGLFQLGFRPALGSLWKEKNHHHFDGPLHRMYGSVRNRVRSLRPLDLSRPHRSLRRVRNAHFSGADWRPGSHGKKTAGDRYVHGDRVPRSGAEHGHRRVDSLFCELAGSFHHLCGSFTYINGAAVFCRPKSFCPKESEQPFRETVY